MSDSKLPDFILIGGSKCGSTSLFEYMSSHPDISACKMKEPHYFTKKWDKGVEWYKAQFREDGLIKFEGSTSYSNYPWYNETPKRIKGLLPSIKLIYIIRHPIERLLSQVHHNILMGRLSLKEVESRDFWTRGGEKYIYLSMYQLQIDRYLEYFNRFQLHILTLEELSTNSSLVLHDLAEFLEISPEYFEKNIDYKKHNVSRIRREVKPGFYNKGLRYLGRKGIVGYANAGFGDKIPRPELSDESVKTIWAKLGNDTARLREYMGRDIGYIEQSRSMQH